jgi:predicted DNA-binding protein (MmcQ/YjbR family)
VIDIEDIRNICLELPGVTEDIKWENDLCFLIAEKMFCVVNLKGELNVTFKVPDEDFEKWIYRDGVNPAPYLARAKWIQLNDFLLEDAGEIKKSIEHSYELVKAKLPKKVKDSL